MYKTILKSGSKQLSNTLLSGDAYICKFFFRKKPCTTIQCKLLHTWVYNVHTQCGFKVQLLKGATEDVKIRVQGQV